MSNYHLKTLTFKDGHSLEIHSDDSPESPRERDNLGTMVAFHQRYNLGDDKDGINGHGIDHKEFCGWDEMEKWIEHENPGCVILPLYLYDHSGLRIKVGSFAGLLPQGHAEFDSGQIGFIFVSREKINKEFGEGKRTDEQIEVHLRGEVETYDQFLTGDIWGYVLREPPCEKCDGPGEEAEDGSCWGFYGDDPTDNGMIDNLPTEFQEALRAGKFTEASS